MYGIGSNSSNNSELVTLEDFAHRIIDMKATIRSYEILFGQHINELNEKCKKQKVTQDCLTAQKYGYELYDVVFRNICDDLSKISSDFQYAFNTQRPISYIKYLTILENHLEKIEEILKKFIITKLALSNGNSDSSENLINPEALQMYDIIKLLSLETRYEPIIATLKDYNKPSVILELVKETEECRYREIDINLSSKEFYILLKLASNPERFIKYSELNENNLNISDQIKKAKGRILQKITIALKKRTLDSSDISKLITSKAGTGYKLNLKKEEITIFTKQEIKLGPSWN